MNSSALRSEIKAWERAFRVENGREPTVQDIKDNPDIAVKYKEYKKLSKQNSVNGGKKLSTNSQPTTPPRLGQSSSSKHAILPKSRAIQSTEAPSPSNPFSPKKHRSKTTNDSEGAFKKIEPTSPTISGSRNRLSAKSTSPDPFPLIVPPQNVKALEGSSDDAPVKKARKRLHGDPVSPSPKRIQRPDKRRRIAAGLGSQSPQDENGSDSEVEAIHPIKIEEPSFVDESPVKKSGGKDFRMLFDEERRKDPQVEEGKKATSLKQQTLFTTFKKLERPPLPPTQMSISADSWSSKSRTTVRGNSQDNQVSREAVSSSVLSDTHQASATNSNPSPEDVVMLSETSAYVALLPPSPPRQNGTSSNNSQSYLHKRKLKSKDKNVNQGPESDDELIEQGNIHILEYEPKGPWFRMDRISRVDGEESSFLDPALVSGRRHRYEGVLNDEHALVGTEETLEVDLPEHIQNVLHISSSRSHERKEKDLVDALLHGRQGGNEMCEVWGVGETDDGANGTTDGEDDWAGEGVPWEVGEL